MLDVHLPHPTHTWKDFFIHIATIVVGLLIAIGLEQTVEYVHHRKELREAREALQHEREENAKQFARNTDYLAQNIAAFRNNLTILLYLHDHPGTPRAKLPGILIWPNLYGSMSDITWRSVQNANVLQLMSREEASEYAQIYEVMSYMNQTADDSFMAWTKAQAYTFSDPDPTHFSPAELQHEIELTQDVLAAKFRLGIIMANAGKNLSGFTHAPSFEDLNNMSVATPLTPAQQSELEAARAITKARMAATPVPTN